MSIVLGTLTSTLPRTRSPRHTFYHNFRFIYSFVYFRKKVVMYVWDHPFKTSACLRGPHVPMVKRSQYIRIKNPLHKHFAGMPMVGGRGQKSWKFADVLNGWSLITFSLFFSWCQFRLAWKSAEKVVNKVRS